MLKFAVILAMAFAMALAANKEPKPGFLELYDQPGQSGEYVTLDNPVPYLSDINFDNRASSYCVNGIYLLHQDNNYNSDNLQAGTVWLWSPELFCNDIEANFNNQASSVRFSGALDNFEESSLNFYQGEGFNGREHFYFSDASTTIYDNEGSSIIVTGCEPWTLYEYDNFEGRAVCIYPDDNCVPGFYPTVGDLGGFDNIVSSVRQGCFTKNAVNPRQGAHKGAAFVVGSFNL